MNKNKHLTLEERNTIELRLKERDHKEICQRLSKPPYVCNGCEFKSSCRLEKRVYSAVNAQREYEAVRSESRQGIQLTEEEALRLDSLISPLIKRGQSLHNICVNHADEIMLNERSLYNH
jgi:IS30 family transposase